ncbi:MAG: nitrophenyl compound nitroreductase subunit ArsF family protein [Candidatus Paceibacterota bacterium]|jgi:hypothetical protein
MKKLLVVLAIIVASCNGFGSQKNKANETASKDTIFVYFFHGTHRCAGCINAEKATVTALNTLYKNELDKGIIKFESVNVEEDNNKALAEKYEAAWNKLLFVKSGKTEQKVDLTEQAFSYSSNQEELNKIIKTTVDAMLK